MKSYTNEEFLAHIIAQLEDGSADIQTDNRGQLVVYTCIFEHTDTTLHDEPDPFFDCEHGETYVSDRMEKVCVLCGRVLGR